MINQRIIPLAAMLAALPLTSCLGLGVRGNGVVETEERRVGSFSSIELAGSGRVLVRPGKECSVVVITDSNIQDLFEARVSGGELWLGFKPGSFIVSPTKLEIRVTLPSLSGLTLSGSGDMLVEEPVSGRDLSLVLSGSGDIRMPRGLDYASLDARLSGSGGVELSATVERASLRLSGSGSIEAGHLYATSGEIGISGSGDVRVGDGACGTLSIAISGSGDVEAAGLAVRKAKVAIGGSGDVELHVDEILEASIAGSGGVTYGGRPLVDSHISGSGKVRSGGR